MLQYVAVCLSVLQCAAVHCSLKIRRESSVLQCVAVCGSVLHCAACSAIRDDIVLFHHVYFVMIAECCSALQCVAVCCLSDV